MKDEKIRITSTPQYVLDAIYSIVAYLQQGGWREAIISANGGAAFRLESVYDSIFRTQGGLIPLAFDAAALRPDDYLLCAQCGKQVVRIGRYVMHKEFDNTHRATLPRIGDQVGTCEKCGWVGKVDDMQPDIDGDGSLGCPVCDAIIEVR